LRANGEAVGEHLIRKQKRGFGISSRVESRLLQMQLELVFPGVSLAFPTAAVAAAAAVVFLPLCFN